MIVARRPPASLVGCRRINRAHPPNFRRLNTAQRPSASCLHCPCSTDSLASSLTSTSTTITLGLQPCWLEPAAGHTFTSKQQTARSFAARSQGLACSPTRPSFSFLMVAASVSKRMSQADLEVMRCVASANAQAHSDQTPEPPTGYTGHFCSLLSADFRICLLLFLFLFLSQLRLLSCPALLAARRRLTVSLRTGPLCLRA